MDFDGAPVTLVHIVLYPGVLPEDLLVLVSSRMHLADDLPSCAAAACVYALLLRCPIPVRVHFAKRKDVWR